MKAAVIYQPGDLPHYADMPEPVVQNDGELLLRVTAAAVKHLDKSQASGTHYSTAEQPAHPARMLGAMPWVRSPMAPASSPAAPAAR